MANLFNTIFSFFVTINLLLLSCFSPASSFNNTDDRTAIQSVARSRTARQYMMTAIDPYAIGLFLNYQQQMPSNTFGHQWASAPLNTPITSGDSSVSSNIPVTFTTTDSSGVELDDETLSSTRQTQYSCGRGPGDLPSRQIVGIVGGSEAAKNSWPFAVAIRYDGAVRCGGFLVSTNRVVTAAHCVEKETSFGISKMSVSLGTHTIGSSVLKTKDDSQMTRRVSRVVMHDGYNAASLINDIAILVLESPVVYSDAISPVCLPPASTNADQYAGQDAAIMGWGTLTSGGEQPDTLQQVVTKIIRNAACKEAYSFLTNNMLCTFTPDKASCQGDSGGPVVVKSASGVWTVVGLNSAAVACGTTGFPSIKTRISAYRTWINNNMK